MLTVICYHGDSVVAVGVSGATQLIQIFNFRHGSRTDARLFIFSDIKMSRFRYGNV